MAWWDDGDDLLGDGPADTLTAAWRQLLGSRAEHGRSKPSFAEALEAYASALHATEVRPPFSGIIVWKGREAVGKFDGRSADPELVAAFRPALDAMAEEYKQGFERPPSPAELVKTLEFLWNHRPQDYLADAASIDLPNVRLRAA